MATVQKRSRQSLALTFLEGQLKIGVKTKKKTFEETVELSDKDKKRINSEIAILKERL